MKHISYQTGAYPNRKTLWLSGILVVLFAFIRIPGLFNDLWLDEIWSLRMAETIHSPWEIVAGKSTDNNHPLNTLFLYLLYPAKPEWTYRLLAWFTGSAAVCLAGLIGRRQFQLIHPDLPESRGVAAGMITAIIFGSSYLFVHYSSEARGYAPAICCGFLAFHALLSDHSKRPWSTRAVVYWSACIVGLLAHVVTVQVIAASLVYSAIRGLQSWNRWRDRLIHLMGWHFLPWAFAAFYYFGFVRHLVIGGRSSFRLSGALGELAAVCLGFPSNLGLFVALPLLLLLVLAALAWMWRQQHRALVGFYLVAIFVVPALGPLSGRFTNIVSRYFILSAALALLLAGYALARLWSMNRWSRAAAASLLLLVLVGNAVHLRRLIHDGRGQYQMALRYALEHTPSALVTITSNHDFRNYQIIRHYATVADAGRSIRYYSRPNVPAEGAQWIFYSFLESEDKPLGETVTDPGGRLYHLEKVFPHAPPLAGWDWYVFRSIALLPDSPAAR